MLMKQISRTPNIFPKLYLKQKHENINNYNVSDFIIKDYNFYDTIKMDMKE